MRIYDSATIVEERLSGFQSPASEFAEKPLSFDERYEIKNPGLRLLTVEVDFPQYGIFKNDQLLVDLERKPRAKSLVVTFMDDEIKLFRADHPEKFEDLMCGVVKVIIRNKG